MFPILKRCVGTFPRAMNPRQDNNREWNRLLASHNKYHLMCVCFDIHVTLYYYPNSNNNNMYWPLYHCNRNKYSYTVTDVSFTNDQNVQWINTQNCMSSFWISLASSIYNGFGDMQPSCTSWSITVIKILLCVFREQDLSKHMINNIASVHNV